MQVRVMDREKTLSGQLLNLTWLYDESSIINALCTMPSYSRRHDNSVGEDNFVEV